MFTSSAYTLPLFTPFGVFISLIYAIKLGDYKNGIRHLIFWFCCLAFIIYFFTLYDVYLVKKVIVQGNILTNEKFKWIKYNTPFEKGNLFFSYLGQIALITLASIASGGLLGLFIVARTITKVAYYVGVLTIYSDDKLIPFLIAWEIWQIVTLIGFLYIILSLSNYFLYWIMDFKFLKRQILKYYCIGILLILSAYFLQLIFQPPTQKLLNQISTNLPIDNLPEKGENTNINIME